MPHRVLQVMCRPPPGKGPQVVDRDYYESVKELNCRRRFMLQIWPDDIPVELRTGVHALTRGVTLVPTASPCFVLKVELIGVETACIFVGTGSNNYIENVSKRDYRNSAQLIFTLGYSGSVLAPLLMPLRGKLTTAAHARTKPAALKRVDEPVVEYLPSLDLDAPVTDFSDILLLMTQQTTGDGEKECWGEPPGGYDDDDDDVVMPVIELCI